jgi:hypothetical protein
LERAGVRKEDFIDPDQYDFIIGVAMSSIRWETERVIRDDLKNGRATPLMQTQYNTIRGRIFDTLDCHSNGAMLCLAAMANGDIKLAGQGPVRLFGPQITPSALNEWGKLSETNRFKLEIYYNSRDPVPRISYAADELLADVKDLILGTSHPGAGTTAMYLIKEVFTGTGLEDLIKQDAPSAEIYSFEIAQSVDCGPADWNFRYSKECHGFTWYQNRYLSKSGK